MSKIVIPSSNWTTHLADAIKQYQTGDVIIVDTEAKMELAKQAAVRMGKDVQVEVEENTK